MSRASWLTMITAARQAKAVRRFPLTRGVCCHGNATQIHVHPWSHSLHLPELPDLTPATISEENTLFQTKYFFFVLTHQTFPPLLHSAQKEERKHFAEDIATVPLYWVATLTGTPDLPGSALSPRSSSTFYTVLGDT